MREPILSTVPFCFGVTRVIFPRFSVYRRAIDAPVLEHALYNADRFISAMISPFQTRTFSASRGSAARSPPPVPSISGSST